MPPSSLIAEIKARLSIAGAQNKLPIHIKNGRFFVPEDGSNAPTTAILKPATAQFSGIHRNELFCMELARAVGLSTPDASILQIGEYQAYIVMRYDRQQLETGVIRLHQEDFCQALQYSRVFKYEENNGPGFSACNKILLHPLLSGSAAARDAFIKCAVLNYILGNCDAHGKNFSLLYQRGKGVYLAPFYDLVSTMVYPGLEQKFAMAIGKTFRFDRIAEHSWQRFAADMHIRQEKLHILMAEVSEAVTARIEPLAAEHETRYGAAPIYEMLLRIIRNGLGRIRQVMESGDR
jgi:serine/threonine-protein kinase HipA